MTRVLLSTEVERWTTRKANPDDKWDSGDTDGQVTNVWGTVTEESSDNYWGESAVIEFEEELTAGDTVYAVVADYESGDTFGRSGGHSQILDAFLDVSKAADLKGVAECTPRRQDSVSFDEKEYYCPWNGYFERLNSVDVWEVVLRPQARDPYSNNTLDVAVRRGH